MRLRNWLVLGLLGIVACGEGDLATTSSTTTKRNSSRVDDGDDEDVDDKQDAKKDAGADAGRKDAGTGSTGPKRDAAVDSEPQTCEKVNVPARPNAPDILIVLDRSGSMLSGGRWGPSISAIRTFTTTLDSAVSFGLMVFPALGGGGGGGGPLGGGSCTPGKLDIPFAVGNATKIANALVLATPSPTGQTPTAASMQAALQYFDTTPCADCTTAPKYVVLVTDGQPNCGAGGGGMATGNSDITATADAIASLTNAGVTTYVVGYGTRSDPTLATAMDRFAKAGGTDQHFAVENEASFVEELTKIAGEVISCEYELKDEVTNPEYVRVEIDGKTYALDKDWRAEGKKIILEGAACSTLRDAKRIHSLEITRECEPIQAL